MTIKGRVLAVDDDPHNLEIIEETLKDQCNLKLVLSGEAAMEEIPRFKPDIVLLDIMMPGLDGYQTCYKIKNDPQLRFTKILMLSAKAMVKDRLEGYGMGADDYVTKPFNDDELLAKVKVYLKLKFLEELDELRRNTLMNISQNIKKPLASMLRVGSTLTQENTDGLQADKLKEQLQQMRTSGNQLMEFCDKAMLLCELKDGRGLSLTAVNISNILRDVMNMLNDQAQEKKIQIIHKNEVNCFIQGDDMLIESALRCILENAITYSPEDSKIFISSGIENEQCAVTVEDQGAGLVHRVFNEVSVNDNNTDRAGEGIGINIAQIIAKMHNGRMTQRRNAKGGVSSYFSVPML